MRETEDVEEDVDKDAGEEEVAGENEQMSISTKEMFTFSINITLIITLEL